MENIIILVLAAAFVLLPLYLKSNMLTVLGMLAFGWVLVYATNNEAILYARSLAPVGGNNVDLVTSLLLGFSPALAAVGITRGAAKKLHVRLMGLLLTPAILATAWLSILFAVSYDARTELLLGQVNQTVDTYQDFGLWSSGIIVILYLYSTKSKKPKEGKHLK